MATALVIAHRGSTSARDPENSLAAFRAARAAGADAVELDVHATADGALIVHHDETVDGSHHITRVTARELQRLRLPNGEPLPTLAQALEATGPGLRVFIEVKSLDPQFDEGLFAAMDEGPNPSGYAVHAFDHRIIQRLGKKRPSLPRGVLSSSYPIQPLAALEDTGATMLWQDHSLTDDSLVAAVHGARAQVLVWTVDDSDEMERLLKLGVDGICTNAPALARRIVNGFAR